MLISILTPSYNYGRYLGEALASVAGQTGVDAEHIVVDDASHDDITLSLLNEWERRIVLARNAQNIGLSATLNHAASLAHGEWIGWLNADDFYLPGTLERVGAAITSSGDIDVVFGDSVFVDENSRFTRLAPSHTLSRSVLRRYGTFFTPPALFIRRSCLPTRGWDPHAIKLMDLDLYLQLASDGARFMHLRRPLGAFRTHAGQASQQRTPTTERERIRRRHGLSLRLPSAPLLNVGALEHATRKLMNGGYTRQRRTRGFAGADMRWFENSPAAATVRRLIVESGS